MFDVKRVEKKIGGHTLSIETGKVAKQADGAVMVQYGETVVLVTAVTAPPRFDDIDFLPLSVDYREKQSAAGKFPGGFIKREGRPSTKEILTARMIDRPIRPLFPDGYFQEVQVMASVLSFDGEHDPDVLAMVGASAALTISKIPFQGPIGACRLAKVGEELVVNPTNQQLEESELNLLLGGRKEAINMIEVGSKEVSEELVADAVAKAHESVGEICDMINDLKEQAGKEKEVILAENDPDLEKKIEEEIFEDLKEKKQIPDKQQRSEAVEELFDKIKEKYCTPEDDEQSADKAMVKRMLHNIEGKVIKQLLLEGRRPDGRSDKDIREITCEVGLLPRNHGSAIFTRGETQAIASVTLGTVTDAQIIDGLQEEYSKKFTVHYNFPPYSVGEARPIRGPGRREIGHGALAERALKQVQPKDEDFSYTTRIVSDITESNGSSSMATVCGGTLALMDAGVPILRPVAGISIGMVTDENGEHKLLTDILGEEDHFGEMDFKVAGTTKGITGIQLDIKAEGLAHNIMVEALERAKQARYEILDTMSKAIETPREQLSTYAPKLISIAIDPEKIGKVIGPGGKTIKKIQEDTGANVDIEDDGTIYISCVGGDDHLKAKEMILAMTEAPKVGHIYRDSKVVSVKDFGVFVEIIPGVEGLCHISELSDKYVKNIDDVCKVGDTIDVKLIAIDDQDRLKLSRKAAMAESKDDSEQEKEPAK
jgi:polyribonucleotide nucleotidyltransferase